MAIENFIRNFPSGDDIPENILKLYRYQENVKPVYSSDFYLYDEYWNMELVPPFDSKVIMSSFVFFGRGGDGSIYSFWCYDGQPLNIAPIVYISSEWDGNTILANSFNEFLALLSLGIDELGYSVTHNPTWHNFTSNQLEVLDFQRWLKNEIGIVVPTERLRILQKAKRMHPDFDRWLEENSS